MDTQERLCLVGIGASGRAITDAVRPFTPDASTVEVEETRRLQPAELPVADTYVVAFWKPLPTLLFQFDEQVWQWGKRWVPIVHEHPEVLVGPVSGPGTPACATCLALRRNQHLPTAELASEVRAAEEQDLALGPRGMLPSVAALAGAAAWSLLDGPSPGRDSAYVLINVITGGVLQGRTVGLHGCPRCGLGEDERSRSTAAFHELLPAATAPGAASA